MATATAAAGNSSGISNPGSRDLPQDTEGAQQHPEINTWL